MTKDLAIIKKETADIVANRVRQYHESGELHLPEKYSPENAVKQAWLILQETLDKNKKPVLETCTKISIANSLLDMVVQALNPMKKQCYFIAYGNKLACQRSYFGTMAVTKRIDPTISDIVPEIIYEGDKFEYEIIRGKKVVVSHKQTLENIDGKKIKAAYCMIINDDGTVRDTEIMTMDEIKGAWKQSKMYPVTDKGEIKAGSTHDKFTAEMAKKTVINRACKKIINSSDDSDLFLKTVRKADELNTESEVKEDVGKNANQEFIDISPEMEMEEEPNQGASDDGMTEEEQAEIEAAEQAEAEAGPGY